MKYIAGIAVAHILIGLLVYSQQRRGGRPGSPPPDLVFLLFDIDQNGEIWCWDNNVLIRHHVQTGVACCQRLSRHPDSSPS